MQILLRQLKRAVDGWQEHVAHIVDKLGALLLIDGLLNASNLAKDLSVRRTRGEHPSLELKDDSEQNRYKP